MLDKWDRFDDAHDTRQAILDYCNRIGGEFRHKDVAIALELDAPKVYRAFVAMERDGECTRLRLGRAEFLWTAIATTTMSASDMRERAARKSKEDKGRTRIKPQGEWHTVNYCDDNRPPLRNQGGQGACRSFGIRSSAEYI